MLNQSNQPQDYDSGDENLEAKLEFRVDKDGILSYNCDWKPGDEGLIGIASIFYKLMVDDICSEILEEIKQQCVLNGNEEDYVNLINIISALALDNMSTETNSVDDIVVPPDRVFSI